MAVGRREPEQLAIGQNINKYKKASAMPEMESDFL
jgi:hypothetical protein